MGKRWDIEKVRNIGISAHIDSGKTTLTERILYYTGKIHAIHDVRGKDGVGAKMDSMELEKERGITIQSAATNVKWKDTEINIIDTPGHVDFTIEVERALRVLDGAILVLCGVAGVQSQSITVDRQMKRYNVARIAFINKLDRSGANPFRVNEALREKLRHNTLLLQVPIGLEDKHEGVVDLVKMKAFYFEGEKGGEIIEKEIPEDLLGEARKYRQELIAKAADFDEELAEKYLTEVDPGEEELKRAIRAGTVSLKATPVLCGSAFKNKGVQLVLDAVHDYLPSPSEVKVNALDQAQGEKEVSLSTDPDQPLVALAFKLEDGRFGQLTYLRVYQGTIRKGEFIYNVSDKNKKLKVARLVQMHSNEMEEVNQASAGNIVALFGAECSSGDTFTDGKVSYTMTSMFVPDPVISLAVRPKEKSQGGQFSKALGKFRREDPTFRMHRDKESNETIISGMGELHLDVYIERMHREFGVDVISGKPQVAYRETISKEASFDYTHKKQTGGAGQFAKVVGTLVPLPLNSEKNYEFVNKIKGGNIPREFIPACDKGFKEEMKKGSLIGAPIVGVQVNLIDGAYHDVDSSEIAFRLCSMAAFRASYSQAEPKTLEPVMKLEVSVPEEFQGNVMGQINQRRGLIQGSSTSEGFVTVEAFVPLAEMFGYSTDLRSATQGKGEFTMEFSRYSVVPRNIQEELMKEYEKKKSLEDKK